MKLTRDFLQDLPPGAIFLSGLFQDTVGVHVTGEKQILGFVAVRGRVPDWAVYWGWSTEKRDTIATRGGKLSRRSALMLVDTDEEAAQFYRE